MIKSLLIIVGALLFLAGCWKQTLPHQMNFSTGAFSYAPVLATKVRIGDTIALERPRVVTGLADTMRPRTVGHATLQWDVQDTVVRVQAEWIELLTNRAWRAEAELPVDELLQLLEGTAEILVIFDANGRMIVGSDPLPTDGPTMDLIDICGVRVPQMDRDIAAEANDHAKLVSALAFDFPPAPEMTVCQAPAQ